MLSTTGRLLGLIIWGLTFYYLQKFLTLNPEYIKWVSWISIDALISLWNKTSVVELDTVNVILGVSTIVPSLVLIVYYLFNSWWLYLIFDQIIDHSNGFYSKLTDRTLPWFILLPHRLRFFIHRLFGISAQIVLIYSGIFVMYNGKVPTTEGISTYYSLFGTGLVMMAMFHISGKSVRASDLKDAVEGFSL